MMSDNDKRKGADGPAIGVVVKPRPKTRKPTMYKVLMLNDDYTPMEFVVHVLERGTVVEAYLAECLVPRLAAGALRVLRDL